MSDDPNDDSKTETPKAPVELHGLATTRSIGHSRRPRLLLALVMLIVMPMLIAGWLLTSNGHSLYDVVIVLGIGVAFCAVVALLSLVVLRLRESSWRTTMPSQWNRDLQEFQEQLDERIASASFPCIECGSVAHPILNSRNRYQCCGCGREFAGLEHNLIDFAEFKRSHPPPSERPYPLAP
jgi:hypothetical protein